MLVDMYLERGGYTPLLHIMVLHALNIRLFVAKQWWFWQHSESVKRQIYLIGLWQINIPSFLLLENHLNGGEKKKTGFEIHLQWVDVLLLLLLYYYINQMLPVLILNQQKDFHVAATAGLAKISVENKCLRTNLIWLVFK